MAKEKFEDEIKYVFEAASLRDSALNIEAQFKTLAKAAKEIAGELEEHERNGVRATKSGKPGELFEDMTNQDAEHRQQSERVASLMFAADVAFRMARVEPSQLDAARLRVDQVFKTLKLVNDAESVKQAAG